MPAPKKKPIPKSTPKSKAKKKPLVKPKLSKRGIVEGRPSKYREELNDQVYKLSLLGLTDAEMANVFGVTENTFNNWKAQYPKFFVSIKEGKEIADSNVADRLYQRAMGFEHDSEEIKVVSDGSGLGSSIERVKVRKIYPPDATAAIFWLKNRQKAKWRDKQEHGFTDEDGKDLNTVTIFKLPDNGREKTEENKPNSKKK